MPSSQMDIADVYNQEIDQDQYEDNIGYLGSRTLTLADVEDLVESVVHVEVSEEDRIAYDWASKNDLDTSDVELVEAFRSNLWE